MTECDGSTADPGRGLESGSALRLPHPKCAEQPRARSPLRRHTPSSLSARCTSELSSVAIGIIDMNGAVCLGRDP